MIIKLLLLSALIWTTLGGNLAQAQSWPNNEPAGMTQLTHITGGSLTWPGWNKFGRGWPEDQYEPKRMAVVSDPASKYGSAVEKRFFIDDVSGWGWPHTGAYLGPGFVYPRKLFKEIYVRYVFKYSSNWDMHSGGEKLWIANDTDTNFMTGVWPRSFVPTPIVFYMGGPGSGTVALPILPSAPIQTTVLGANDGRVQGIYPDITKNQYHTIEYNLRTQDPGQENGYIRFWFDGVQITRWNLQGVGPEQTLTNKAWKAIDGTPLSLITARMETPIFWGGQNDTKTVNDWIRVSEIYISGSGGTGGTVPAAPSGLSATAASASQINLTWADNSSNETGFKIERKTGSGGTYSQIATVGANATSYNNTGLSASTTYYYRVRAYNGSGDSAYSNEANATTQAGGGGGIAFRAASSSGGSGTSATLNKPTGVVSGDLMLAAINLNANVTVTAPSGWTLVRTITDSMVLRIYRKTAGSSEPASYTWTLGGTRFVGGIVAFSGVNATTPIQVENGAAHTTTASTTHTTPSITTSGSATWLVSIFGDKTAGGSTWTPPSGATERVDVRNTGTSSDMSLEINTVGPVAAGSKAHTATASISSALAGMAIIALQP